MVLGPIWESWSRSLEMEPLFLSPTLKLRLLSTSITSGKTRAYVASEYLILMEELKVGSPGVKKAMTLVLTPHRYGHTGIKI
jgi:hypothetical protein